MHLSQGNLLLSNIVDYVDIENENVWVSFNINHKEYKWNLQADDDWLDINIFTMFNKLLSNKNCKKQLAISVLDQSILIGFFDDEQVANLNELSKFEFKAV